MKKYILFLFISLFSFTACNDAKETVYNEFKASTLLKKYEYFKDLSAAIDKKRADIELYQNELSTFTVETQDDKFYKEQRKSELFGIIAMHNQLCADYNSAMSKFNYRFTNVGDLPNGATTPLPREIKPYINSLTK